MMEKIRLGDIATTITKGTTPTTIGFPFVDTGINFVKIESIDEAGNFLPDRFAHITDECNRKLGRSKLEENDILFSIAGAIGRTAIVTKSILPANTNQALAIIRIPSNAINLQFVLYALQSQAVAEQSAKQKQGVAQLNLSLKNIADIQIPLVSSEKQAEIVRILAALDVTIGQRKEQIKFIDQLVKSRFIELFAGVEAEDTLQNLCTFIDYRGKTPEKVESGLPFITAKNIRMHHMSFDTLEYISKETYDRVMTRGFPQIGDVVFTTEAPLGNVCRIPFIETEFYIGQRIITMQTERLEPAYLEYALSSDEFKRKIAEKSSGSTVTGIRSKLLEQLTIPVPPRAQQQQFAAFVEQTDKSKLAVQKGLQELEILKKSLMQQYFG